MRPAIPPDGEMAQPCERVLAGCGPFLRKRLRPMGRPGVWHGGLGHCRHQLCRARLPPVAHPDLLGLQPGPLVRRGLRNHSGGLRVHAELVRNARHDLALPAASGPGPLFAELHLPGRRVLRNDRRKSNRRLPRVGGRAPDGLVHLAISFHVLPLVGCANTGRLFDRGTQGAWYTSAAARERHCEADQVRVAYITDGRLGSQCLGRDPHDQHHLRIFVLRHGCAAGKRVVRLEGRRQVARKPLRLRHRHHRVGDLAQPWQRRGQVRFRCDRLVTDSLLLDILAHVLGAL
mmetsp:Transcript_3938/g.10082  ORF Transcript_3938/g.10082 Transcript_3938/m.10082 type:complete len:289 (+) Transcript_3938:219-1085(+)